MSNKYYIGLRVCGLVMLAALAGICVAPSRLYLDLAVFTLKIFLVIALGPLGLRLLTARRPKATKAKARTHKIAA